VKKANPDRYIEGFLAGQAVAYCERVNTGTGIAAQLVCPDVYMEMLTKLIAEEHCKALVAPHESGRISLWIYRDELAKRIILALQSAHAPTELEVWSMGKLFGYANQDVLSFIERSTLACPEGSNPHPSSGSSD
jgi:hypothetical protein